MPYRTEAWYVTTAGTNSGATATKAAVTGSRHVITGIYGFGDVDCVVTLTDGGTVIYEQKWDISNESHDTSLTWPKWNVSGMEIVCGSGAAVTGVISASTADCRITITGYTQQG